MDHNTLMDVLFVFSKAADIKKNPEKREKSVRFAVEAIIISVFMAAFVCVGGILMASDSAGLFIVGILLAICGLSLFVLALVRLIAQFTINRHAMTWVALAVFLTTIIGPAVAVVCLIFLG